MNTVKIKTNCAADRFYATIRLASLLVFLLFTIHCSLLIAEGQDGEPDSAPPPLKQITKDEQAKLDAETDPKLRMILELNMMSLHISDAEKDYTTRDYDAMYRELGRFQFLIDDGLAFLAKINRSDKRLLDHYKRYEITLRGFVPRIEIIRREAPPEYEPYLGRLLKYIREARERALDPMFSDTVVPVVNKKP